MTAILSTDPQPVIGWDATRKEWLEARRPGLGASDVAAVLGFSRYTTPWQVWAAKNDVRHVEDTQTAAAELGDDLEPWLLGQAARILGRPVERTPARLYRDPQHPWRMASPDGVVAGVAELVECKTAGLASGYGYPDGWTEDSIPLGYEIQARWQLITMQAERVHVVGLVAGMGVVHHVVERDLGIENELLAQVGEWWQHHMVDGVEPPLGAGDGDVLRAMYPRPTANEIDLDDTDAAEIAARYRTFRTAESEAKAAKKAEGARLQALLKEHAIGLIEGRPIVTWDTQNNTVDWEQLARDMAAQHDINLPDPETYRRRPKRVLGVKEEF